MNNKVSSSRNKVMGMPKRHILDSERSVRTYLEKVLAIIVENEVINIFVRVQAL
jgi:hypothetical protein